MSLLLNFNVSLFHRIQRSPSDPTSLSQFPVFSKPSSLHSLSLSKSHICFTFSPSSSPNYDREEARWLREEQRWLREEQRWLREESRWNSERESLLSEIQTLKLRIQALERHNSVQGGSVTETVANLAKLLQEGEMGKQLNQIVESGSSAAPLVVDTKEREEVVVVKEVVRVLEEQGKVQNDGKEMKSRVTLKKGSEGDEVRAMQEALLKLGFYSGEEDMEYSSFSSGTERAVKTWQAAFGAAEDGVMTAELLERLYMEQPIGGSGLTVNATPKVNDVFAPHKGGTNGVAGASMTEISEIQQTVVNEEGITEVEVSQHRVFLLGENRWEEPSRLSNRKNRVSGAKSKDATTKCLSCRGEGRLLCTECDGTGEPNIEPQFVEWIDEGTKCPYCEGLGYTICDICEGKTVTQP